MRWILLTRAQILGAEQVATKNILDHQASARHLFDHVAACRALPGCALAPVYINIEQNLVSTGVEIVENLRRMQMRNAWIVMERRVMRAPYADMVTNSGAGGGNLRDTLLPVGTLTTRKNKWLMVDITNSLLSGGMLSLVSQFVVARPHEQPPDAPPPDALLLQQMQSFERIFVGSSKNSEDRAPAFRYSGKRGGRQDDFACALLIAIFCHHSMAHGGVQPEALIPRVTRPIIHMR